MNASLPESDSYLKLFKHATVFVMDVDGVLTDGTLLITEEGDLLRKMNIKDGFALNNAVQKNYPVIAISGSKSEGVEKRLQRLGLQHVFTGIQNKKDLLQHLAEKLSLSLQTTIYIGDDLPDLEAMQGCGIPCCPADAVREIQLISNYVSSFKGGKGCVRDIIEKVMKLQGRWL
jgi:3-deoxy-D-manno-octulosonate 8-phosphate phosphatase (KDO 8-P phosphatase)